MSKIELNKIMKLFQEWKEKSDKSYPSFLLYSRCFLSFSKDENAIIKFIGKTDDKKYGIVFILKNNYNMENKYTSNADIEFLSAFRNEREVLFFPFSSFEINKIQEVQINGIKITQINLNYLGKYEQQLKQEKNIEQIIPKSSFQNLIVQTGIIKNINYTPKIIFENEDKYIKEVNTNNNLEKSLNEIICEYDIKEIGITQILNCFEEAKKNESYLTGIYNEKEMKEKCELYLNGNKINFCFKYNFKKKENIQLKLF